LPFLEAGSRHSLAQAAFLDEGILEVPELAGEQVGGHADQANDHIGRDRRVGVLDAFAECLVGRTRDLVQLAEPERVGMLRGPLLKAARPQEIPVVGFPLSL
jgi:hypothetical protein